MVIQARQAGSSEGSIVDSRYILKLNMTEFAKRTNTRKGKFECELEH